MSVSLLKFPLEYSQKTTGGDNKEETATDKLYILYYRKGHWDQALWNKKPSTALEYSNEKNSEYVEH